ncbi:MAG: hypothetical protein KJZ69_11505 [Phycisphaerales bacterium]|nr:hypothetical protein [Phycisphaerales bacterium]
MNNRANAIWAIIFVVAAIFLGWRIATGNFGRVYVKSQQVTVNADDGSVAASWETHTKVPPRDHQEEGVSLSIPRTIGLWAGAILTLCIFSFLYGDNPFYKTAESIVVGASAAYLMVIGFWTQIIPNLIGNIVPDWTRTWATPGLDPEAKADYVYLLPLMLSIMLLWRLAPVGGWISRWPLAFFIGATAGFRLIGFMEADFVAQIRATIIPIWVKDAAGGVDIWASIGALTMIVGVISCLIYFFFSLEHKGVVGKTARLGIWFLMVTFGAGFGYTVMGRIALLSQRLEFLFYEWLWLDSPTADAVSGTASLIMPALGG